MGNNWRLIATAPTDGTHVLLYHPTFDSGQPCVIEGWYENEKPSNSSWACAWGSCGDHRDDMGGLDVGDHCPTHWQPLPASPQATQGSRPVTEYDRGWNEAIRAIHAKCVEVATNAETAHGLAHPTILGRPSAEHHRLIGQSRAAKCIGTFAFRIRKLA